MIINKCELEEDDFGLLKKCCSAAVWDANQRSEFEAVEVENKQGIAEQQPREWFIYVLKLSFH